MGRPQPNQALELTAPSAGFVALRGVVAWGPQLTAGVRSLNKESRVMQICAVWHRRDVLLPGVLLTAEDWQSVRITKQGCIL
jgi:hypothetical protein